MMVLASRSGSGLVTMARGKSSEQGRAELLSSSPCPLFWLSSLLPSSTSPDVVPDLDF